MRAFCVPHTDPERPPFDAIMLTESQRYLPYIQYFAFVDSTEMAGAVWTGDSRARFCERLGLKVHGPTRRRSVMAVAAAIHRFTA